MELQQQKTRVAWLSVLSNATLVLVKLAVGLAIGSVSVISEAIHSGMDLIAAVIALFAVRTSGKPADRDHPYGHGKFENISGTIEALLIFVAAGWIVYEAVRKFAKPHAVEAVGWGVGVMLLSALLNTFVSQLLFRVGRKTDSAALQADAWHLRTDVWTSAGVTAALGAMWIGQHAAPLVNLRWLDPAAAIAVALLILRAAYQLTIASARDLLDVSLPHEEKMWIREHVCNTVPRVYGFHRLRTRKSGHMRFIDFHLLVDARMSVEESHDLAEKLEHEVEDQFPHSNVTVHVEPCDGDCTPNCLNGCLLADEQREAVRSRRRAGTPGPPAGPSIPPSSEPG